MKKFTPVLSPDDAKIVGGFGSNGRCDPPKVAAELFKVGIPGTRLACYMLRRFGWPNTGSDDHKDLCEWTLTTPMPGLHMSVCPKLYDDGTRAGEFYHPLHFGVRFNEEVRKKLDADPVLDAHRRKVNRAIVKWWKDVGSKLYSIGCARASDADEKIVQLYVEQKINDIVNRWGIFKRRPEHGEKLRALPAWIKEDMWFIQGFLKKHHPVEHAALPSMSKEERLKWIESRDNAPIYGEIKEALEATMRDLCRPVYVRDHGFNIFGDVERNDVARKMAGKLKAAKRFDGAGHAPKYWFTHQAEIKAESKS